VHVARRDHADAGGPAAQQGHGAGADAERRDAGVPAAHGHGRAGAAGRLRLRLRLRRLVPVRRGQGGVRGPRPGAGRRGGAARGADLLRAPGRRAPPRPAARGRRGARRPGLRRALRSPLLRARQAEQALRRRRAPRLRAAASAGGGGGARAVGDIRRGAQGSSGAPALALRQAAPAVRVRPHGDPRVRDGERVARAQTGGDDGTVTWPCVCWQDLDSSGSRGR
jgi:hypothetical protein